MFRVGTERRKTNYPPSVEGREQGFCNAISALVQSSAFRFTIYICWAISCRFQLAAYRRNKKLHVQIPNKTTCRALIYLRITLDTSCLPKEHLDQYPRHLSGGKVVSGEQCEGGEEA